MEDRLANPSGVEAVKDVHGHLVRQVLEFSKSRKRGRPLHLQGLHRNCFAAITTSIGAPAITKSRASRWGLRCPVFSRNLRTACLTGWGSPHRISVGPRRLNPRPPCPSRPGPQFLLIRRRLGRHDLTAPLCWHRLQTATPRPAPAYP